MLLPYKNKIILIRRLCLELTGMLLVLTSEVTCITTSVNFQCILSNTTYKWHANALFILQLVFQIPHHPLNIYKWKFLRIVDLILNKPLCKACLVMQFEWNTICFEWWLNTVKLNDCIWVQIVSRIMFQAKNSCVLRVLF